METENLPDGVQIAVYSLLGRLCVYWNPEDGRIVSTVSIGVYYHEGELAGSGSDGLFKWKIADELLHDTGTQNLIQLRKRPVWSHIAFTGGILGGRTLYGISLDRDSKIYKAELDIDKFYPRFQP